MNDKELQELYLQRTRLNFKIAELEKEKLQEARNANKNLVGRCYKQEEKNSTTYLKIISLNTKYESDKYAEVFCFILHPAVFNPRELFSVETELIDTIHTRYLEIDKQEFNEKARELFNRMLDYEVK